MGFVNSSAKRGPFWWDLRLSTAIYERVLKSKIIIDETGILEKSEKKQRLRIGAAVPQGVGQGRREA
jgi:hypothetical protein